MDTSLFVAIGIVLSLVALCVYAVLMQRKGLKAQNYAIAETIPAQQEAMAIAREGIVLQRETTRLLGIIAKAHGSEA